jgi:hypothetical protein
MVKGFGRDCATQLGLIGGTVDTGHAGPDLLDVLAELHEPREGGDGEGGDGEGGDGEEVADACDGWDREWRQCITGRAAP